MWSASLYVTLHLLFVCPFRTWTTGTCLTQPISGHFFRIFPVHLHRCLLCDLFYPFLSKRLVRSVFSYAILEYSRRSFAGHSFRTITFCSLPRCTYWEHVSCVLVSHLSLRLYPQVYSYVCETSLLLAEHGHLHSLRNNIAVSLLVSGIVLVSLLWFGLDVSGAKAYWDCLHRFVCIHAKMIYISSLFLQCNILCCTRNEHL
jgi:hypothetical protein